MTADQNRLPRRDWLILPLLSLLSLVLLLGISEIAARVFWSEQLIDSCGVPDPKLGLRFKPNCRSEIKSPESPWLDNTYNACGFRTAEGCGPKAANEFRVAVIGSSISNGYLVPYAESLSARATALLERQCHIPVDFQNLAVPGAGQMAKAPLHLDAALALQPNIVLMALSEFDLEVLQDNDALATNAPGATPAPPPPGLAEFVRRIAVKLRESRAVVVAQHFLFENIDAYLPLYLKHGDEADYLRPPLSPAWQRRMALFDREVGEIATRSAAAGAPLMLVFVPARAQAALLHWKNRPPGISPTLLGQEIAAIARRHDVAYIDLTETIADRSDAASLYYPVDGHPNGAADAIIATSVVSELLARDKSLSACRDSAQVRN